MPSRVIRVLLLAALAALAVPPPAGAFTYHVQTTTGAAIVPGDTRIDGVGCDDCTTPITFPFPVPPIGYLTANVSSNGNLQFFSSSTSFYPGCLPVESFDWAIVPHQADLRTDLPGNGIFTGLYGTAPNRIFVVEWRASFSFWAGTANFEIVFSEGSETISVVYGDSTDHGAFAVSGVQQGVGAYGRTAFSCLEPVLTPGLKVDYVPVSLDLVVRGADNGLYQNRFGPAGWLGWTALGGAAIDAPALQDNGALYLAVRGPGDAPYVNRLADVAWDGWTQLPGAIADAPALTYGPGSSAGLELVARGTDNGIYHNRFTGESWLGWTPLGGAAASAPAIVQGETDTDQATVHAVVRGADNGVYHNVFTDDTGWAGWSAVGGATADTPAVEFDFAPPRKLHVVIRGTDNHVYHNVLTGGVWTGWTDLGAQTASAPALLRDGPDLHLAIRGIDNSVMHNQYTGGVWTGWVTVGGGTLDTPALAFGGPPFGLHVVIRGTDDGIYDNVFDGLVWSGWTALGGSTPSRPALVTR